MKTLIAASAMMLLAGAAVAGEGRGNPFPYRAQGSSLNSVTVISPEGAAQEVQSLNSLPRGFEDGTVSSEFGDHTTRMAQPVAPSANTHG